MTDRPILRTKPVRKPIRLPAGPLIERVPSERGPARTVVTTAGREAIVALASSGAPQNKIAASLGISSSAFKALIANDAEDDSIRLAWEAGRANLEHELADLLLTAAKKGNAIATLFYLKNMGWSDTPPVQTQVGVQIVLPESLSDGAYSARLAERNRLAAENPRGLLRKIDGGTGL